MNIGLVIKERRKQKELTQDELANRVGINKITLSNIERGDTQPSKKTLESICKALELSEPLIYIQALEETDVAEDKRDLFKQLYPIIKSMLTQLAE